MDPQISWIPDPKNSNILYPMNDPHYSPIQQYYNNIAQYKAIDAAAADLAQRTWKQWAVGAVLANNAGQMAAYRPAPVAPKGHAVTWNGTAGVISDGAPVWSPDPNWNVEDWQVSQTGTGEDLVKVNDPARHRQTGGFAGVGTPSSAPAAAAPAATDLSALIAQLLAALAAAQKR